jgi:hypothetical protein
MKLAIDRLLFPQWQYQPGVDTHDPNPPLPIGTSPSQEITASFFGNLLTIDDATGQIDSYPDPIDLTLAEQATFYGATISQTGGAGSITGALFTNTQTFYTATVSASYGIAGTLFTDADTFYAATVASLATITGALFTDADTFYAATIVADGGPQTITGALAANDNEFFGATVSSQTPSTRPRGWDDSAPAGRRPRRPIVIYEDEPVEAPKPKQVKVTRKAVQRALESADAPVWPLSVKEAVNLLPAYVQVLPELGKPDTSAITAAIVERLKAEFVRRAMEADEDDIEMLLLVAA